MTANIVKLILNISFVFARSYLLLPDDLELKKRGKDIYALRRFVCVSSLHHVGSSFKLNVTKKVASMMIRSSSFCRGMACSYVRYLKIEIR